MRKERERAERQAAGQGETDHRKNFLSYTALLFSFIQRAGVGIITKNLYKGKGEMGGGRGNRRGRNRETIF